MSIIIISLASSLAKLFRQWVCVCHYEIHTEYPQGSWGLVLFFVFVYLFSSSIRVFTNLSIGVPKPNTTTVFLEFHSSLICSCRINSLSILITFLSRSFDFRLNLAVVLSSYSFESTMGHTFFIPTFSHFSYPFLLMKEWCSFKQQYTLALFQPNCIHNCKNAAPLGEGNMHVKAENALLICKDQDLYNKEKATNEKHQWCQGRC